MQQDLLKIVETNRQCSVGRVFRNIDTSAKCHLDPRDGCIDPTEPGHHQAS